MSSPKTIKIDEIEYIRADSLAKNNEGPIKIVIADKGFVYVGHVKIENGFIIISRAKNIRRYGTSKGLGQLVTGPTAQTILDDYGTVRVPERALISLVDVEQEKWKL